MVLDVVDVQFIRRRHVVDGWSVRKLARTLGHSRKTIQKYLEAEDPATEQFGSGRCNGLRFEAPVGPFAGRPCGPGRTVPAGCGKVATKSSPRPAPVGGSTEGGERH